ncbi:PQQ-binding-like beta-propeller repeat protein [Myxococcota bacterium]|nr:PQQ-binding-like beta-propeller repeat protein [Myxococcota bacterium]
MTTHNEAQNTPPRRIHRTVIGLLTAAVFSIGCGDWVQFGNGPLNPHRKNAPGPQTGIASVLSLLHASALTNEMEVGVLVDHFGDYFVSSYSPWIHLFFNSGAYGCSANLGVNGSRAVPYLESWERMLFTGAEGGGFHAIEIDKSTTPCTMNVVATDATVGKSESSPKRAMDKSLYMAEYKGIVHRWEYVAGALNPLGNFFLGAGEHVTGGIALYDVTPDYEAEEVLVATVTGNFYVLDHELTTIIWSESTGYATQDEYYAGVTVAERGTMYPPVALLPIASRGGVLTPNSGLLRAIDLSLGNVAWELTPSNTAAGEDEIVGSVAVLFDQPIDYVPGDDNPGGSSATAPGNSDFRPPHTQISPWHATFASTDEFLYGVDLVSGAEIWSYHMRESGYDAPVVDRDNLIYVGDGTSRLHAVNGQITCLGCLVWMDGSLVSTSTDDIVKLGLTREWWKGGRRGLVVGTRKEAFALWD